MLGEDVVCAGITESPLLAHLTQYCSGGELFDYIVARERLKVREAANPLSSCHELSQS